MSVGHFHGLCQRYKGRGVEIKTHDGGIHRGIIRHVDNRNVYLQPLGSRTRNLGGFGYGGYGGFGPGPGYGGYGPGFGGYGGYGGGIAAGGLGIALGAIGTLALLPFGGFI
ncbi:hypothetical protein ACUL41_16105 [Virgibacillus natechei]|uniref:hypothetical protein n=1 Tax=Virgibacillus sp. CBA3643 TaxID=2942278 RepID=UPI0035A266DC